MRSLSILALALATGITAVAVSDDGSIVPGTAQVKYCEDKDYALSFDKIDMEPDPAIRGENVTIIVQGSSKEAIPEGSIVELKTKRNIMSKTFQQKLCEMEGTECGTNNLDFTFESEHKIHKYQAIFDYDIEVRFLGPGEEHKETLACVKGKLEVCALTEGNEKCTPN